MSRIDPLELPKPTNLNSAIVAKAHALTQVVRIEKRILELKKAREAWDTRVMMCAKLLDTYNTVETLK